jgi:acyl-CoA thioesterase I
VTRRCLLLLLPLVLAAAPKDPRPVIVCFGDSLTAGYGLDPGLGFPEFLQKTLDAQSYHYRIANLGISGDTTSGGVSRTDSAISLQPKIVILELGANDGLRGLPLSATRANLEEMIGAFQKAGARVLLAGITLPRNYGPDYIKAFEQIYAGLAAKFKLPLIPFLLESVAANPALMQRDRLHPTAEGNRRVAATVFKYLQPLLKK